MTSARASAQAVIISQREAFCGPTIPTAVLIRRDLAYKNTDYQQMWGYLAAESGQPVDSWMRTWTLRRGFPVVSAKVKALSC